MPQVKYSLKINASITIRRIQHRKKKKKKELNVKSNIFDKRSLKGNSFQNAPQKSLYKIV